ncbi:nitroreductase family protein [Chryseobacterium daeguense]|uniref:nitroreductase family protein n=1 Tax=Chryseobacterium daeguense TaxID=412438 RepID=UPI00040A043C|nr:nitroreductase family protein [Chryseobacterium daeguense]
MSLLENLKWRYTTKKFGLQEVERGKVDKIIEAVNLSASSGGLQPYRVFVIQNKEIQKKLRADSFNAQIEEASHLLVFASFQKITKEHIDDYINLIIKERGTPISELEGLKTALESWHLDQSAEQSSVWAAKQAYIGLGTALIAAAEQKVDATPMEGFDPQNVDEVLKLKEKGLKTAVMLALGYRDAENDWNTNLKKVRLPINEFAVEVK